MRKSISTAFFSLVSTLMVLGIVMMGCSEWVLFKNYFARDRYETLDQRSEEHTSELQSR